MTKRDYILIASCIARIRSEFDADTAMDALTKLLATRLREDNRRFNIVRFTEATQKEISLAEDADWLRTL